MVANCRYNSSDAWLYNKICNHNSSFIPIFQNLLKNKSAFLLPFSARTDRSQYWIGLNDILTQMDFMWSDGSPVRYTNWAENEPNNFMDVNEDCVGMFLKVE